jgi:hypothetical protein
VDVVRVPVVTPLRAEEGILDADLLVFLSNPAQFLVHIAGGHQGTIGVVYFTPVQWYRVGFPTFLSHNYVPPSLIFLRITEPVVMAVSLKTGPAA